jgi:hypothetical protein
MVFRKDVFVSYSHTDRSWLERLQLHLAPFVRGEKIQVWDDRQIAPGANWAREIDEALSRARVAVLLVSPAFLASPYVAGVELPAILQRSGKDLTLLWVPIHATAFEATPLRDIQAALPPNRPLAAMPKAKQEEALVQIARHVAGAMDINAVGNAFRIIDAFEPEVAAFTRGTPEPAGDAAHSLYAKQVDGAIHLVDHGQARELVTAEQLTRLDPNAQKLIRAYERTMKDLFERWTELKPKRIAQDPEIRQEARDESKLVRGELCGELNELLGFIESLGMQLQDHYAHVRYICAQRST